MKIEHLNATFQPAKIGHPHGLQVTYLKDNSTRNIFIYHEDGKVGAGPPAPRGARGPGPPPWPEGAPAGPLLGPVPGGRLAARWGAGAAFCPAADPRAPTGHLGVGAGRKPAPVLLSTGPPSSAWLRAIVTRARG